MTLLELLECDAQYLRTGMSCTLFSMADLQLLKGTVSSQAFQLFELLLLNYRPAEPIHRDDALDAYRMAMPKATR